MRFQGLEFRTERVQGRRIVSVRIRPRATPTPRPRSSEGLVARDGRGRPRRSAAASSRSSAGRTSASRRCVNQLVGSKVAIVSDRPQTTRTQIRGVRTTPDEPDRAARHARASTSRARCSASARTSGRVAHARRGRRRVPARRGQRADRARRPVHRRPRRRRSTRPRCSCVNKTDVAGRGDDRRAPRAARSRARRLRRVRARSRRSPATGVDALVGELEARLPEGPHYYPDGRGHRPARDRPRGRAAAREAARASPATSCPHSITVVAEEIEPTTRTARAAGGRPRADDVLRIRAVIRVERESQKGIVIGKGGRGAEGGRNAGPAGARGAARGARLPRDAGQGRARLAAPRRTRSTGSDTDLRKPWSRGLAGLLRRRSAGDMLPRLPPRGRGGDGDAGDRKGRFEAPDDAPEAVGAALALVVGSTLLLAACSDAQNNGQNPLRPNGPQAAEDRRPLHADLLDRGRRRRVRPRRRRSTSPSASATARARTRTPSRSTATRRSRSAGRSSPRCILAIIAVPTITHDLRPRRGPGRRHRSRSRSSASSGGGSSTTRRAKIVTANELVIPTGTPRSHLGLSACDGHPHRGLQRHPQLLGPRARRARPTSSPATTTHEHRGRQARDLPRAVRRVLRPVARQHALPRDRQDTRRLRAVGRRAAAGPGRAVRRERRRRTPAGPARS